MSATKVDVLVILLNDDGDREEIWASAASVDDAVEFAEEAIRKATGDDTYVMTEWEAG